MAQIPLKVKRRETGKQASKKLRRDGYVPGVFYFKGEESIPIYTDPLSLRPIVYTSLSRVIKLDIEGAEEPRNCVLKDINFHPVTDRITRHSLG